MFKSDLKENGSEADSGQRKGYPGRYRPHVDKIMKSITDSGFSAMSAETGRRSSTIVQQEPPNSWNGPLLESIYGGMAVALGEKGDMIVSIGVRNATYFLDFSIHHYESHETEKSIVDGLLAVPLAYEVKHCEKFLGMALPKPLAEKCPTLCTRMWKELDIVPFVIKGSEGVHNAYFSDNDGHEEHTIDELADSMSRRCISFFDPNKQPYLQVGFRGDVDVDCGGHAVIASLKDYEESVNQRTWRAVKKYAEEAKERKLKIAFFSATPQGGGVALMRHALVRFLRLMGVDVVWYVPRPSPEVFRITKTNHNILQGVSLPEERLTQDAKERVEDWIVRNAQRYWVQDGGPLAAPEKGGADVVIIDDPQMPGLIPLIKKVTPHRPVIYRSHIQIRSDLVAEKGSPQAEVWDFLWETIQKADIFISHPVKAFVPHTVNPDIVGYLPATTDWLDGLNKEMDERIAGNYGRVFNAKCRESRMITIDHPEDDYIVQIARFDPSKGIFDVLNSYAKFFDMMHEQKPHITPPKLLICGHGSVDDPDGALVFDLVMKYLDDDLRRLKGSVCVLRVPPSDQILNTVMWKAKVALQLSTREGFEIKVSEALHHGKPVIASLAGGIPLQVQDGKNGFLVGIGDTDAVAKHLFDLWTDKDLYDKISEYARTSVSDELSTVGNALAWLYLATQMSKGEMPSPKGRWINDMAREEAGEPYGDEETKVPRDVNRGEVPTK
ncbi:hypothetical protein KEM55_004016 [Ascosphaera atra]|nr:hypothetical protein KEM55_004016 [Ascosphaera atra]